MNKADVPVFILCGGLGTRFKEETEFRPKPMIPVGPQPIVWHIMRWYAHHGFKKFVLCLGYKGETIKSFFRNYTSLRSDFTVNLKDNSLTVHSIEHEQDWEVTLADTGALTMTGGRVARAAKRFLGDAEHFAVTYGDGLTDAPLSDEWEDHLNAGLTGTVLGVNPPSRFGEFVLDGDKVVEFNEKPTFADNWINGGYFFFNRKFIDYVSEDESCILERSPLSKLAKDGGLHVFKHPGFWACMDTQRDHEHLQGLWDSGKAPWVPGGAS